MAERRRIDVIKLDEKALRRLHEKLKRIGVEDKNESVAVEPKKERKKRPAMQVYQPGVTRLSNRKIAANFEQPSDSKPSISSKCEGIRGSRNGNRQPQRGRGRLYHPKRDSLNDYDEEGFLTRHNRRLVKGEATSFSDEDVGHDDELAWDNYGGSGLVHEEWNPQIEAVETPSQERDSTTELTEEESDHGSGEEEESKQSESDEEVPSVATSGSNKDFYKVAHSVSSLSDNGSDCGDDKEIIDMEDKPRLYDPSNPSQPILVRPGSREKGRGRTVFSEVNVYDRNSPLVMPKIAPISRSKRSQPRRSPPRYYGHCDNSRHDYGLNSPVNRSYHYSENLSEDEDSVASRSRSMRHQSRITMLNEAERYECTLSNLLASPSFDSEEYNESLSRTRSKLKVLYEKLIVNDIEEASNESLDQKLWKNVYYQVIEILREQIRSCPEQDSSELRDSLILLLDQGTAFYESLLENLQQKHRFNLKDILNSASARKRQRLKAGKRSALATLSCQRVFICLGDIARYREQATHTDNYGRARHCYLQAQLLAPKNGRPYNQLAILAVKTRHKLDAVYYYVRSLAASNPILSARESLMALFDEVRRKLAYVAHKQDESLERVIKDMRVSSNSQADSTRSSGMEERRWEEVWILPGNEAAQTEVKKQKSVEEIPELNLPPSDIAKHFTLIFLNIHGKLFTRIGLESFPTMLSKLLKLFEATVTNLRFMTTHRLLQVFSINLFAILNAEKLSIHGSAQDSTQNQHRALRLAFSMLAITVNHLNKILLSYDPFTSEELVTYFPAVKIMFDWMYMNKNLWYPPPEDLTVDGLCLWRSLADLCNFICNDPCCEPRILLYNDAADGLHEVFLMEDTQLAGFSPLGQSFSDPRYVENEAIALESKIFLQQTVRISVIREFLEYLCGMEEPLLAFKQGKYISVGLARSHSWGEDPVIKETITEYDADDFTTTANDSFLSTEDDSGEFSELRKLRDSLQIKKDLKERREKQMKSSLKSEERVKLEICPKFLVPDTNCFIDHLDFIKKLIDCQKFKVATPLVVISELEGLTNEKKDETSHAEQVQQNAKKAVAFIKKCVTGGSQRFCVLTKKGSELNDLRFRSEDTFGLGNNDDFILQSAHGYARLHVPKQEVAIVNGEKIVHRNVVLLTDDRNLRLKALLTQDVVTTSIKNFCAWLKLK